MSWQEMQPEFSADDQTEPGLSPGAHDMSSNTANHCLSAHKVDRNLAHSSWRQLHCATFSAWLTESGGHHAVQ